MINWGYVVLLLLVGAFTYNRKALDLWGTLAMVIMGIIIIFSAGISWLLLILIFLILSLVATRQSKYYKQNLGIYEGKRTAKNVISNGVVAFIMAAFGGYYLPLVGGFIGAIATATADTLASEIGILQRPRLITTMRKVDPGTDGAISVLGTLVGIIGAAIIGIAAFFLGIISDPVLSLKIAVISGTVGCFMDSILGAVFERRNFINNEHVNLLATITGALVGIISTL
ncbi:MAG: TIGR00297 family protein [Methanobrevibacter arboriphilus]|nr:TIGR00297 family protein [Methanobrevibacter arboriphilus]MBF4469356.1 TIGR00297 family protein [Methanobrevibacter arboriphilus]MCC7561869.1 TIGR00297 family protein [Methanobrevibacter arboriphilus]